MTASPETYVAYTDESGTREQYLALGGIFLPKRSVAAIEGILDSYCRSNGFDDREVSWKKCSLPKVERCIAFATLFWSLADDHGPLDFRALVVDTHRNPLRKKEWDCETDEDGLYKFYHFFISNAFRRLAAQVPRREIVVAALDDQYPYRTEILRTTIGGALEKQFGAEAAVTVVQRATPKHARVHQLADLLLGAVSYRFNRSDPAAQKQRICDAVEARVGRLLNSDFGPDIRPFNVWTFTAKGSTRWAKGSQGTV